MVGGGGLVVAGGDPAPLFEVVEAAFDDVAAFVGLGVEGGWAAAGAAAPCSVADLVFTFGDGAGDVMTPQPDADGFGAVALVTEEMIRAAARPSRSGPWNTDGVHDVGETGAVVDVAAGHHERQRTPQPVTGQMDLAGQPAPGPPERPITAPLFRAPAAC